MHDLLASAYPWIKAMHIVSVIAWMAGLFYLPRLYVYHAEQVQGGIVQAEEMFATMERRLLRDRGLFLNHGITSADVDSRPVGSGASEFIDKYVFPNGELPHLHLVVREMSAQNFEVYDVESLRPHYAKTLAHWSRRLEAQIDAARRLVSEKTLRVWRAYLAGCSYGFAQGWMNVYQVLASRQQAPGLTELPLTRAWMYR